MLAGRPHDAAVLFGELDDSHPAVALQRARLALLDNDLEEAIRRLLQLRGGQPGASRVEALLAEARYRSGDFSAAADCYAATGRRALANVLSEFGALRPYALHGGADATTLGWLASAPAPVINARVNEREVHLMVDTGTDMLLLDPEVAAAAEVTTGASEPSRFAGGQPAHVRYGRAAHLDLEQMRIEHVPVCTLALGTPFREFFPATPIDGILGTGVLARFRCTFDYRRRTLTLEPGGQRRRGNTGRGCRFWWAGTHYLVTETTLNNGHRTLALIDTGMAGTAVAVPAGTADAAGLQRLGGEPRTGYGGGGAVNAHPLRVAELCVDHVCRREVPGMLLADFPLERHFGFRIGAVLAHDLFAGCRMRLDFDAMRIAVDAANDG
jgi:predicted aspartyl protease